MQIPIISGIYSSGVDVRAAYPVNYVPVPKDTGVNRGYLRPAPGIVANGTGPGIDRGGINWNDICYRVMGSKLVTIAEDGTVTTLGDVGSGGLVSMDYSFAQLAIASNGDLFYWDGSTLTQNTDPDLGVVNDVMWIDGYFMTTDGESLIVTELNNPLAVSPFKYGSSEIDPDPIKAVRKVRNEAVAINRFTIEFFDNVGGDFFPFQRIDGAQISKGAVGTHACCVLSDILAFVGSGKNEAIAVYVGVNGSATKISTDEVDKVINRYSESILSEIKLESKISESHQHLMIHLPDRTIVYDLLAAQALQEPVWFTLTTATDGFAQYRAHNIVRCYNRWLVSDPLSSTVGYLDDSLSSHYGEIVRWEFSTFITYNEGRGAIINDIELAVLRGVIALGLNPQISTSYSTDGETWSQDKSISVGTVGNRNKRMVWFKQGSMRNYRMQRFKGDSQSYFSVLRLEVAIEALYH
jgi:hypothetical protein